MEFAHVALSTILALKSKRYSYETCFYTMDIPFHRMFSEGKPRDTASYRVKARACSIGFRLCSWLDLSAAPSATYCHGTGLWRNSRFKARKVSLRVSAKWYGTAGICPITIESRLTRRLTIGFRYVVDNILTICFYGLLFVSPKLREVNVYVNRSNRIRSRASNY